MAIENIENIVTTLKKHLSDDDTFGDILHNFSKYSSEDAKLTEEKSAGAKLGTALAQAHAEALNVKEGTNVRFLQKIISMGGTGEEEEKAKMYCNSVTIMPPTEVGAYSLRYKDQTLRISAETIEACQHTVKIVLSKDMSVTTLVNNERLLNAHCALLGDQGCVDSPPNMRIKTQTAMLVACIFIVNPEKHHPYKQKALQLGYIVAQPSLNLYDDKDRDKYIDKTHRQLQDNYFEDLLKSRYVLHETVRDFATHASECVVFVWGFKGSGHYAAGYSTEVIEGCVNALQQAILRSASLCHRGKLIYICCANTKEEREALDGLALALPEDIQTRFLICTLTQMKVRHRAFLAARELGNLLIVMNSTYDPIEMGGHFLSPKYRDQSDTAHVQLVTTIVESASERKTGYIKCKKNLSQLSVEPEKKDIQISLAEIKAKISRNKLKEKIEKAQSDKITADRFNIEEVTAKLKAQLAQVKARWLKEYLGEKSLSSLAAAGDLMAMGVLDAQKKVDGLNKLNEQKEADKVSASKELEALKDQLASLDAKLVSLYQQHKIVCVSTEAISNNGDDEKYVVNAGNYNCNTDNLSSEFAAEKIARNMRFLRIQKTMAVTALNFIHVNFLQIQLNKLQQQHLLYLLCIELNKAVAGDSAERISDFREQLVALRQQILITSPFQTQLANLHQQSSTLFIIDNAEGLLTKDRQLRDKRQTAFSNQDFFLAASLLTKRSEIFEKAVKNSSEELLKLLIIQGADVQYAMKQATSKGEEESWIIDRLSLLLDELLFSATQKKDVKQIRSLLTQGANTQETLQRFVKEENFSCASCLDKTLNDLMYEAASKVTEQKTVEKLITQGGNVRGAIQLADSYENVLAVTILKNIEVKMLFTAAQNKEQKRLKVLITKGATEDTINKAIMLATDTGSTTAVHILSDALTKLNPQHQISRSGPPLTTRSSSTLFSPVITTISEESEPTTHLCVANSCAP